MIGQLLVVCLLASCVVSQDLQRYDIVLDYHGTVDWTNNVFHLSSASQTVRTMISPTGSINYEVINQLRGAITKIDGTIQWITKGQSFNANMTLTIGGSHVSQPHILHASSLGPCTVLPAHHDIISSIGKYNIDSGEGAFLGASGGITVNGQHALSGKANWIVNVVFWAP
eukprot:TRINITY_DN919_c0_g1_i1.p1 TRINITY_DN919_c0_g1~~TRINITY_DN919_c0_g1_i1.p1  ORF type:complete len:170 (-),score=3.47 TRINITY_DN919_c0_g1_i1:51-560(-)